MYFVLLITVTAGLVATAAFFSVVGIASMFAYNYIPAMVMGIMLESGKIAVAVYLYRYWSMMSNGFKGIMAGFLVVLMFITSVGIFGYLSQGYQKTSEEYKLLTLELKSLEEEHATKKRRAEDINRQVDELPGELLQGKIRLSREFSDEVGEIRDRLTQLEPQIQALRVKRVSYESHIGPIAYVAQMLELPQDKVVFYAILLLVLVADPLAITLTVACNMALIRFWDRRAPSARVTPRSGNSLDDIVERARVVALRSYGATFEQAPAPTPARASVAVVAKDRRTTAERRRGERRAAERRNVQSRTAARKR
jgi:hypothetical protein